MHSTKTIRLGFAFKLLWRDWKSGELNILIASLLLAIATVTSISLFTSRIHNSIYEEATHFLAADAKISGTLPIPPQWLEQAESRRIKTARIIGFRAMTFSQSDMILTQVKAVSEQYPLKGNLIVSDRPRSKSRIIESGPMPGEAWLAPRLFNALNIVSGDKITIGEAEFFVTASLNREPDSGQSLFGVAPRVMINIGDVKRTGAVQVGSRVDYALLLSGKSGNVKQYEEELRGQLGNHHQWRGVESENRGVGDALSRAERFLLLTGCLSVVLTGVAIALAARRFAKRQQGQVAILKTLGAKPKHILSLYCLNIFAIGVLSLISGALLGWLLHWGIIQALGDLIPNDLAEASSSAYITGAMTGFVALWAFAAPPIFSLRHVSPASIFREEKDQILSSGWSTAIGGFALLVLMLFYSRDIQLTAIVCVGALVCFSGVGLLSSGLIILTKKFSHRLSYTWRLGFANLKRHQRFNALQIMIFSLLFMLLFILINIRTTLIGQWQNQLPPDTPNHFVFNIFPADTENIQAFFKQHDVEQNPFYPMTRGRVVSVNGLDTKVLSENAENNMNYRRELNLTWSPELGKDNEVIAGEWWGQNTSKDIEVSVEEEYAKGLNINIGDKMEFSVAGQTEYGIVTSIRSVKWDSMNPNFFVIFNHEILSGSGANWITSFYLPQEKKSLLNTLSRKFPTISLIEIDQTIEQIQGIIAKVSMAIEFILLLVLASGVLVLLTSIQATLDVRKRESAIFRTLGANKKLVRFTLLIEFFTLGLLAGILAVIGTEICLYFLQTKVFQLEYESQFLLWIWGPTLSAVAIAIIGWNSTRAVINTPPLAVLREI